MNGNDAHYPLLKVVVTFVCSCWNSKLTIQMMMMLKWLIGMHTLHSLNSILKLQIQRTDKKWKLYCHHRWLLKEKKNIIRLYGCTDHNLIQLINENHMWNGIELYQQYVQYLGIVYQLRMMFYLIKSESNHLMAINEVLWLLLIFKYFSHSWIDFPSI